MNRIDDATEGAVRRFLVLIANRCDLAGAIVYGSRARGTHHPDSDADVAVLLRGGRQGRLEITLEMGDVAFAVLLETGIDVSPLPVWLDGWEHPESHSNPSVLHAIAREGVRL
jgi:predicted nucleotidyltransferase